MTSKRFQNIFIFLIYSHYSCNSGEDEILPNSIEIINDNNWNLINFFHKNFSNGVYIEKKLSLKFS